MSLSKFACWSLAIGIGLGTALAQHEALADDTVSKAKKPRQLVVKVIAPKSGLDAGEIRRAIALELGVSVLPAPTAAGPSDTLDVTVHSQPLRAEVVFRSKSGKKVARSISLPAEPHRATETIALLAGNLVRDEAAELLAAMNAAGATATSPAGSRAAAKPAGSSGSGTAAAGPSAATATKPTPPSDQAKPEARASNAKADAAKPSKTDPDSAAQPPEPELESDVIDLAFFHPISYPSHSLKKSFVIELGLLYGRIGALEGAGMVVGVSRVHRHVYGAQLSGLVTVDHGKVHGVSYAGIATWVEGEVRGAVGAGVYSHVKGTVHGVNAAPVAYAGGLDGLEAAVVSVSGDGRGVQLGVANVARDQSGLQLGLVNVGRRLSGVQLGLVNVAEEVDGAPVGLVSITRDTDYSAVTYSSLRFPVNAAFKMRNGYVFSELGGGVAFDREVADDSRKTNIGRFGAILGAHIDVGPIFVEPGVGFDSEVPLSESTSNERQGVVRYRGTIGWQLLPALGVIAGAELRQEIPEDSGSSRLDWDAFAGVQLF